MVRSISDSDEYNKELREKERRYREEEAKQEPKPHEKYYNVDQFKDKWHSFIEGLVIYTPVEIEFNRVLAESDKAILLEFLDGTNCWVSKRFGYFNFRRRLIKISKMSAKNWELSHLIERKE
jgi:hypothetical protein